MADVRTVRTAHTADLDSATLRLAHALLVDVFEGDFDEYDWDHALGGVHALVWDGGELVGHGSVVQRQLTHGGQPWRTGYVEAVGVRADLRGHGFGATVMAELERVIRMAYPLGALSAAENAATFYTVRGWRPWLGPTYLLGPEGACRTEDDDGGIHVLPVTARLDRSGELYCDWRAGDVW